MKAQTQENSISKDYRNIFILWLVLMATFILLLIYAPRLLSKLVSNDPKKYFTTGYHEYQEQKYDAAIQDLTKAVELAPKDIQNHKFLGLAYNKKQDWDNAIKEFSECIKLDPTNTEALDFLAWNYYLKKDYLNALAGWTKITEINPNLPYGFAGIGRVYSTQQKWKESIPYYEKSVSLDTTQWETYHEMGRAYEGLGDTTNEEKAFLRVIQLNPKEDDSYFRLGLIEETQKKWDQAIDYINKAMDLNPTNPYYIKELANAYMNRNKTGDFQKAITLLENFLKTNPSDMDAKNRLDLIKSPHK
jgi:tetratricopeptide (TPR) repeat protein